MYDYNQVNENDGDIRQTLDEAIKSFEFLPDKIRQNVSKVKFLVAGKDFQITPSGIITFEKYD